MCTTADQTDSVGLLIGLIAASLATGYNVISVPLAAGVLAFAGVVLSPAAGTVLMSVSTIVVAPNAQLLRRGKLNPAQVR